MQKFPTCTLYLNRSCPNNCPQCGIRDPSKQKLTPQAWMEACEILQACFDTEFFLILGTEPLLMGEGLVDLVKYWTKMKMFYGLYSTSPEPYFSQLKKKLVDAGLTSWSAGIDTWPGLPNMFALDKVIQSVRGLDYMADAGVTIHTVTTVNNYNLEDVALILRSAQERFRKKTTVTSSLNAIEWQHDETFDFFSKKEKMMPPYADLVIPPERHPAVLKMCEDVRKLMFVDGYQIQTTARHLNDWPLLYRSLNSNCQGLCGFAVDCDGRMRRCGYNKGTKVSSYTVWDIERASVRRQFIQDWQEEVASCPGCFWVFKYCMEEKGSLKHKSEFYTERQTGKEV